jgi:hypothetical protein
MAYCKFLSQLSPRGTEIQHETPSMVCFKELYQGSKQRTNCQEKLQTWSNYSHSGNRCSDSCGEGVLILFSVPTSIICRKENFFVYLRPLFHLVRLYSLVANEISGL